MLMSALLVVQNTLIVLGFSVLMTQFRKKLLIRFRGGLLSWEPFLDLIRVLSVPKHGIRERSYSLE